MPAYLTWLRSRLLTLHVTSLLVGALLEPIYAARQALVLLYLLLFLPEPPPIEFCIEVLWIRYFLDPDLTVS